MPFDAVTTRAVVEDLRAHLLGGRVDKVVQPDDLTIALLIRAESDNQWLVLSAGALDARVQRTLRRQSSGFAEAGSFVMLLRKYLEGARLHAASQVGVDRVIRCVFQAGPVESVLIAEIMGRMSNVILADPDMLVLGALKHVRASENRFRVTLPRHPYVPPPRPMQPPPHESRPKLDPLRGMAGDLAMAIASRDPTGPAWKALLDCVDGVSPTLARETVRAVQGSIEVTAGAMSDLAACAELLARLKTLFGPERGRPSAIWQQEKLVEYAAFPLTRHGAEARQYPDIAALLDEVYGAGAARNPMAGQQAPVVAAIEELRKGRRRKIASLEAGLVDRDVLASMRARGEMVLAFQHGIEDGQRELLLPEMDLKIPLDPALTPLENAQRYFKQYGKARDAAAVVPGLLEEARQELAYLDQLAVHAAQADDPQSLAAVREELRDLVASPEQAAKKRKREQGRANQKGGKGGTKAKAGPSPLRLRAADGTEILVGRSARQNDAVTFALAGHQDLWLHARQIPGAHVILRTGGRPPGQEALLHAATLAATYSQGRGATTVPVDYTPVRNVRRIKGGKPGLVHYSGETTIVVRPETR